MHHVLEFDQWNWLKPYIKFISQRGIEAKTIGDKDRKAFQKLMTDGVYSKTM